MRRLLLALCCSGLSIGSATAQTSSKPASVPVGHARLAVARQMVDLMKLDQLYDQMFVQLSPAFAQSVLGAMATGPASKPLLDALIERDSANKDRMVAILSQEFLTAMKRQYLALRESAAKEYAAAFDAVELTEIVRFYSSGTGAKVLALMPQLQTKMAAQGREFGKVAGAEAARRAFDRIEREMAPNEMGKSS